MAEKAPLTAKQRKLLATMGIPEANVLTWLGGNCGCKPCKGRADYFAAWCARITDGRSINLALQKIHLETIMAVAALTDPKCKENDAAKSK